MVTAICLGEGDAVLEHEEHEEHEEYEKHNEEHNEEHEEYEEYEQHNEEHEECEEHEEQEEHEAHEEHEELRPATTVTHTEPKQRQGKEHNEEKDEKKEKKDKSGKEGKEAVLKKKRKRDKFRALLGLSDRGSDDAEQEGAEPYSQPKEQMARRFPKPVHLDTAAKAGELQRALNEHMACLERETLGKIEGAIECLVKCTTIADSIHLLTTSLLVAKERLERLEELRAKVSFRNNIILTGGYRSMLIHVYENCRDIIKVTKTKIGTELKLAHFTTSCLDAKEVNKLLEPRVYTFSLLEEKLQLIIAMWTKRPQSTESESKSESEEFEFQPMRLYADICKDVGCRAGKVFGKWHFGYQSKAYLCSFALAMKALHVCCKESAEWGSAAKLVPSGAALAKLPHYITSPKDVVAKYTRLREEGMPLEVLQDMWNLMESNTLSYLSNRLNVDVSKNSLWAIPKLNPFPIILGTCIRLKVPVTDSAQPSKKKEKPGVRCTLLSRYHMSVDHDLIDDGQGFKKGFQGGIGIVVDVTKKKKQKRSPIVVLHIHGGGFISQSPLSHLVYLKDWAKRTKIPILSVDYTLSPEAMFPQALNECYAVYKWLQVPANCASLGLCKEGVRIILAGDSAGGNLSLAVCAKAIEDRDPSVKRPIGLLLHYPVAFLSMTATISRILFENDPVLNFQAMSQVARSYLGAGAEDVPFDDHHFSPGLVPDHLLKKFPPTYLAAGDVDPLIDDAIILYERFERLGVRSVVRFYRHLPHGYLNLPILPGSYSASIDAAAFLHYLVTVHMNPFKLHDAFDVQAYRSNLSKAHD